MPDVNTWVSLANTAGSIVVVVLFLKFLVTERESRKGLEQARLENMAKISSEYRQDTKELTEMCSKVVRDNTKALTKVEQCLNRVESAFESSGFSYPPPKAG